MMPDYQNPSQGFVIGPNSVSLTSTHDAPEESVLAEIDGEVARLLNVIDMLGTRLYKVLTPEYATATSDSDPHPVTSQIRSTQRALSTAIDQLVALSGRIEA
jgi:hypothetical protein